MKKGFVRAEPPPPPAVVKPEPIALLTPLKTPPPEGKSPWLIIVGVVVIGLILGIVVVSYASGAKTFTGSGSIMPVVGIAGIGFMMLGSRLAGGSGQQMTRGKLDALRGRFLVVLDELRERIGAAADRLDVNRRWYHPSVGTLAAAVGGPQMWSRSPSGSDLWFGVVRVGVGMTSLEEGGAVKFAEPTDMPTQVELEPATGIALEAFVRAQSVAYGTPALVSLLVEPGYRLEGPRELVLGLMRAMVAQMTYSHGPDHLRLVVVSDDVEEWDWVKWLPHHGDSRRHDAVGPARLCYRSVRAFADQELTEAVLSGGGFTPRHGAARDAVTPLPHTVVISDIGPAGWSGVLPADGLAGFTFFDLGGGVSCCRDQGDVRLLQVTERGDVWGVPRDATAWTPVGAGPMFFATSDQLSREDAEDFAALLCRWRIAAPYEAIGDEAPLYARPRDILSHYGIEDPADIDFARLWRDSNINDPRACRVPFANRYDNGELLFLDIKDMNHGGDGPHGVMAGSTGSGKTTALRTLSLSLMLDQPPWDLQVIFADCKGGAGVKPFVGTPHVAHVITDLEDDQVLMERFVEAMWGEIARRKEACNAVGADDADEYQLIRAERARQGEVLPPLARLVVVIDEFAEAFRIMSDIPAMLDQVGRQGRSYWVHLLMASQEINSSADDLLGNVDYRIVLRMNKSSGAVIAGVPAAVNLPREVGAGYLRVGPAESNLVRFRAESLWRDYRKPGTEADEGIGVSAQAPDYVGPQLFTTAWVPLPERVTEDQTLEQTHESVGGGDREEDEETSVLRKPKIGPVILDQLRRKVQFEPYRLWQPPLDRPRALDDVVEMYLGRPWDAHYGANPNLVFPVGVIDRPFKQDQQPLLVDANGDGTNQLVIGTSQSGKTVALQTAICAAAMTHTPEQVQFYVLALSGAGLGTVAELPHVGAVVYGIDDDGVRRTISEMVELMERRQRSFPACGIRSLEDFRHRKFAGAPGEVPDDPYGDVFLVIDNIGALSSSPTLRNKELVMGQVQRLVLEGGSFGIHVLGSVNKDISLPPHMRGAFPRRVELKLGGADDAKMVAGRLTNKVPAGKPGRGMVAQNYVRLGAEEVGLHTLIARPALRSTADGVFDSASIVEAVRRVAARYRPAPPVRRLPQTITLGELRTRAGQRGHSGMAWAIDETDRLVGLHPAASPFLIVTGREQCGRTNTLAAIMSEIRRVYAPGSTAALRDADPADPRPRAQVWLVNPARELLRVVGPDYLQRYCYRPDEVAPMARELAATLAGRLPESGLGLDEEMDRGFSGPEIFLIVDDAERLPPGIDAPLRDLTTAANAAGDVGLRIVYARRFGGWSQADRMDPLLAAMKQGAAQLLVMNSDEEEGFVRGRWRGHAMPVGRGILMSTAESGRYVQIGHVAGG